MANDNRILSIEKATQRTWDQWLDFMESINAAELDHHQIALKVGSELDGKIESADWWAQSVTVAFEQHIGRRIVGQVADGTFQTSVSRTTKFDMSELMDKWIKFAERDSEVSKLVSGEVRRSGTDKRLYWRAKSDDGSDITVATEPRNTGAAIVATHTGLPSQAENQAKKQMWTEILERFVSQLT